MARVLLRRAAYRLEGWTGRLSVFDTESGSLTQRLGGPSQPTRSAPSNFAGVCSIATMTADGITRIWDGTRPILPPAP